MKSILIASAAAVVAIASAGAQSVAAGRFRDLDSLAWRSASPGIEMALMDGDPRSTGDFTYAMRFKTGAFFSPHWHPNETRLLVVRGEIRVGFADDLDTLHARVVGPGGFAAIPANAHHFEAGKTDALVMLSGTGPLRTTFVKPQVTGHP